MQDVRKGGILLSDRHEIILTWEQKKKKSTIFIMVTGWYNWGKIKLHVSSQHINQLLWDYFKNVFLWKSALEVPAPWRKCRVTVTVITVRCEKDRHSPLGSNSPFFWSSQKARASNVDKKIRPNIIMFHFLHSNLLVLFDKLNINNNK